MLQISADDGRFRDDFESGAIAPELFTHREHVRLAYIYLCEGSLEEAHARTREATAEARAMFIDPDIDPIP